MVFYSSRELNIYNEEIPVGNSVQFSFIKF